jgi:hypothetical protein
LKRRRAGEPLEHRSLVDVTTEHFDRQRLVAGRIRVWSWRNSVHAGESRAKRFGIVEVGHDDAGTEFGQGARRVGAGSLTTARTGAFASSSARTVAPPC